MKTIIIEDEALAARNLVKILNQFDNLQILTILETIVDSVSWLEENPAPNVIFMDIHLADGSAFEIFKRTNVKCPVIFTTAYDEYALKAFKVNSIDYLLKPVEAADVKNALKKLETIAKSSIEKENIDKLILLLNSGNQQYKTTFLVETKGDKLVPLGTTEIAYIFADSGLVKAVTSDKRKLVLQHTLDELSKMLNPKDFFRANRQYIISRNSVKDIDLWFNNRLSINLTIPVDEKILVSKARVGEFKNWFS